MSKARREDVLRMVLRVWVSLLLDSLLVDRNGAVDVHIGGRDVVVADWFSKGEGNLGLGG